MTTTAESLLRAIEDAAPKGMPSTRLANKLERDLAAKIGQAETTKLLTASGVPKLALHLRDIRRKVKVLNAALAQLNGTAAPSHATQSASMPAMPAATVTIRHVSQPTTAAPYTRRQCLFIMAGAFNQGPMAFIDKSDAEVFEAMQSAVAASRTTLPGVRDKDEGPTLTGHAAIIRGAKQDRLNAVIKSFKK